MSIHNQLLCKFGNLVGVFCNPKSMYAEIHALLSEDILYISDLHDATNSLHQCDGNSPPPQSWRRYSTYAQIVLRLCRGTSADNSTVPITPSRVCNSCILNRVDAHTKFFGM